MDVLTLSGHPWAQLLSMALLSVVVLVLTIVDKPYRGLDGHGDAMTHGDKQMVLAQVLQLVSYSVIAFCMMDSANRHAHGAKGLSDTVELAALLVGLLVVVVQLCCICKPSATREGEATSMNEAAQDADSSDTKLATKNPIYEDGCDDD